MDFTNNNDHTDLTPLEDPDQSIDHVNLNNKPDRNTPDGPRTSSQQKRGMNVPSRLEKAIRGVKASAQWKQEEKIERRKNLADIREEERRNELRHVEEEARQNLGNLDDPSTLPKVVDQVLPSEELHNMFEKLSIRDKADISHNFDTILLTITECSTLSAQHLTMDAPKSWEEAQKQPEAAEWKTAIHEELETWKSTSLSNILNYLEVPKLEKGLLF